MPDTEIQPAAPRPRKPRMPIEVRREEVLDAALRLIVREGYAATTMEAVAREAELAKPRVYSAFPGRGRLLLALFEREEARAVAALAEAMPELTADAAFDDVLVTATTNLLQTVAANPYTHRLLVLPSSDAPPEVQAHRAAAEEFALGNLRALFTWGRTTRPELAGIDLELAARSVLAIGEQAVRLVLTQPEEFTPERYAAYARSLLAVVSGVHR